MRLASVSSCLLAAALALAPAGVRADAPPVPREGPPASSTLGSESPPPLPPAPAAAPASAAPAAATATADGAFDFDLFGDQPAAKPLPVVPDPKRIEFERRVKLRRKVLQLHQGFGFTTLGLLAVTLILGQLNYLDKYGGGDLTGRYQYPHLALASLSTASFATTGLLALLAPTPYKKELKADRALLHKVMMTLATAGMVAQVIMGPLTSSMDGNLNQRGLALGHLVTGYASWAFMATGMMAFVF